VKQEARKAGELDNFILFQRLPRRSAHLAMRAAQPGNGAKLRENRTRNVRATQSFTWFTKSRWTFHFILCLEFLFLILALTSVWQGQNPDARWDVGFLARVSAYHRRKTQV